MRNWIPAGIGNPAHQAVESIDLADQMAFAESADSGIAGHLADGRRSAWVTSAVARPHAGSRSRRLAAGMAAAHDDDVEAASRWIAQSRFGGRRCPVLFHVKHLSKMVSSL